MGRIEHLSLLERFHAERDEARRRLDRGLVQGARTWSAAGVAEELKKGANPRWANSEGWTALISAAFQKDPGAAAVLLPVSDVDHQSALGWTAAMIAARNGNWRTLALIGKSANLRLRDFEGLGLAEHAARPADGITAAVAESLLLGGVVDGPDSSAPRRRTRL